MIKRHMAGIILAAICFASTSFCQTTDRDQALNLFRQERWSEAASAFEALENQQPGQTDALLYRGKCLVNLKAVQRRCRGAASLHRRPPAIRQCRVSAGLRPLSRRQAERIAAMVYRRRQAKNSDRG
jgi:hypothetical protein